MNSANIALILLQIAVLIATLFGSIRAIGTSDHSIPLIFFAFAMTSVLLSDFYWLAYMFLRPETRMPFAANEIAEWAMFLLLGTSLTTGLPGLFCAARRETLFAALFSAANAALWGAWSGEWVQDIMTGAALGYLLCCLASRLKGSGSLSTPEWGTLGGACVVLIAAESSVLLVPESFKQPVDLLCYALLFAVAAFLILLAALTMRKGGDPDRGVGLSFAAFAWCIITMYLSTGTLYFVAFLLVTLCFQMMFLSLRKEAAS